MNQVKLFIDLTRLKKPIGYMLLFWPCAWGLTLAYDFSSNLKDRTNLDKNWTNAPIEKATMTDKNIPKIIWVALDVFMYVDKSINASLLDEILIIDMTTAAPKSSKTMETVVEVGRP